MTPLPPHLPPKASSRKQYHVLQTLPWLLFFVALCALTAIAMSVMLFAWYIPTYVSYQVPTTALRTVTSGAETSVDPLFVKEREQRMFTLYAGTIAAPPATLSSEFRIAEAISLSSDGYISFVAGTVPASMIAVSSEGSVYEVRGIRREAHTNIRYAQVVGEGFRVVPFGMSQKGETVFVEEGGAWNAEVLQAETTLQSATAFSLHEPAVTFSLDQFDNALAYNGAGNFVGFVYEGLFIPSWWIQQGLDAVLSEQLFTYNSYPYKVREVESVYDTEQSLYRGISGLEVVQSGNRASATTLAVGDIILKVNGETPDRKTVVQLMQSQKNHTLQVLRNGLEVDISL